MEAPEAMERTNNALLWNSPIISNNGADRPAAVIIATVAEPCKRRIIAAAKKAKNSKGKPCWPTYLQSFSSRSGYQHLFNMPPAPVNKIINLPVP